MLETEAAGRTDDNRPVVVDDLLAEVSIDERVGAQPAHQENAEDCEPQAGDADDVLNALFPVGGLGRGCFGDGHCVSSL